MALTCGFFNSIDGDRKYDATQFASLFDGVITDGVVAAVGDFFATIPGGGMVVNVGSGRAWFNRTWTYSDAKIPLTLDDSDLLYDRIDAVVLEVDTRVAIRDNTIKVIKGTPEQVPSRPVMKHEEGVHQYALAYVLVRASTFSINSGDITINVGKEDCPFVTSIIDTPELEVLFAQWDSQFREWFENIQSQLEGDIAANLQRQIDERVKISDKATDEEAIEGINDDKWMTPKKTKSVVNDSFVGETGPLLRLSNGPLISSNSQGILTISTSGNYFGFPSSSTAIDVYKTDGFRKLGTLRYIGNAVDYCMTDTKLAIFSTSGNSVYFSLCSYENDNFVIIKESTSIYTGNESIYTASFYAYKSYVSENIAYTMGWHNDTRDTRIAFILDLRSGVATTKTFRTTPNYTISNVMVGSGPYAYVIAYQQSYSSSVGYIYKIDKDSLSPNVSNTEFSLTSVPSGSEYHMIAPYQIDGERFAIGYVEQYTPWRWGMMIYDFKGQLLAHRAYTEAGGNKNGPRIDIINDGYIYTRLTNATSTPEDPYYIKIDVATLGMQRVMDYIYAYSNMYIYEDSIRANTTKFNACSPIKNRLLINTSFTGYGTATRMIASGRNLELVGAK